MAARVRADSFDLGRDVYGGAVRSANARIDYILIGWPRRGGVGSATSARLGGDTPHDGVVPSDHYAIIADLRH